MGKAGRKTVSEVLPALKKEFNVDFVIAQAENINDHGKGPAPKDLEDMQIAGVDFFSGGNHSFSNPKSSVLYETTSSPLVRPANVVDQPGLGSKIIKCGETKVLVASILGQTVGTQQVEATNPLYAIDNILMAHKGGYDVSVINFHGDFSSEKRVFGYYLDGRVSVVVGDHWHVPTADAMIMPKGTAHITDVGMCGALHSSLGVKTDVIIKRWKHGVASRNEMEDHEPYQFNALLVEVDAKTGLSTKVEHIQRIIEK
jgi:2',3'-cyclic-nucleotide 2'-phosphodiesterase